MELFVCVKHYQYVYYANTRKSHVYPQEVAKNQSSEIKFGGILECLITIIYAISNIKRNFEKRSLHLAS